MRRRQCFRWNESAASSQRVQQGIKSWERAAAHIHPFIRPIRLTDRPLVLPRLRSIFHWLLFYFWCAPLALIQWPGSHFESAFFEAIRAPISSGMQPRWAPTLDRLHTWPRSRRSHAVIYVGALHDSWFSLPRFSAPLPLPTKDFARRQWNESNRSVSEYTHIFWPDSQFISFSSFQNLSRKQLTYLQSYI